jgi:hypothetical protein
MEPSGGRHAKRTGQKGAPDRPKADGPWEVGQQAARCHRPAQHPLAVTLTAANEHDTVEPSERLGATAGS